MASILATAGVVPRKEEADDNLTAKNDVGEEKIADLAYTLWQQRGCPIGSPEFDWLEAERQLHNSNVRTAAGTR